MVPEGAWPGAEVIIPLKMQSPQGRGATVQLLHLMDALEGEGLCEPGRQQGAGILWAHDEEWRSSEHRAM